MLSMNQLYMQHVDIDILEYTKKHTRDEFDRQVLNMSYRLKKIGVPVPKMTQDVIPPKYNPQTGEWDLIDFQYPPGPRIFYEELGLSFEEAISGVLFDITHKTKDLEKVTRDHIISLGHGFNTRYLRPEGWIEEKKERKGLKKRVKKIKKLIKFKKAT